MSDKRELMRRDVSGGYAAIPRPAASNRDARQIARKAENAVYALQAAEQVYSEAQRAATNLRTYAVGLYAGAAEQMVFIQNSASAGARDYVEPFAMGEAYQLATDLQALGNAAVGNFQRTAAQNYLPEPKRRWFER